LGTAGITASLICAGVLFLSSEKQRVDAKDAVQSMVSPGQELRLLYDKEQAGRLLRGTGLGANTEVLRPTSLVVIYSYGDFRGATKVVRSDDGGAQPIEISRESGVPSNKVIAFFANPFANFEASRAADLRIDNALIGPVPDTRHGWLVAITLLSFVSFYAVGPGVCVWLALSELMPTRIRSNGMSIALVLNQAVSTTIAAVFLPTVGKYGYSSIFFGFAACTMLYFVTATWFLPETKGKTLEEIQAYFSGAAPRVPLDAQTTRRPA
jgi:hypothetical protein